MTFITPIPDTSHSNNASQHTDDPTARFRYLLLSALYEKGFKFVTYDDRGNPRIWTPKPRPLTSG